MSLQRSKHLHFLRAGRKGTAPPSPGRGEGCSPRPPPPSLVGKKSEKVPQALGEALKRF